MTRCLEGQLFRKKLATLLLSFPLLELLLFDGNSGKTFEIRKKCPEKTCCYDASRHCRRPVRRILAEECHNRLVPKLFRVCLDLLEKVHGWDINCPSDVATCAVLTAQVDHNHVLLIPKLGHAEKKERTIRHNLVATK